jgi:cupin 2 domain-containing protein
VKEKFKKEEKIEVKSLLHPIPNDIPEEIFETILQAGSFRVERIVSKGHSSPDDYWYDQKENEWVLVIKGRARLQFDDPAEIVELMPGDTVNIPAHKRHRVAWTDPDTETIWLTIHYAD